MKDFVFSYQKCPTFTEMLNSEYPHYEFTNQVDVRCSKIVEQHFDTAIEDFPYLMLMAFLAVTLPWRFHYLKKALF